MHASESASRMFTGAAQALETRGDEIWEVLCDEARCDVRYKLNTLCALLSSTFPHLSPITLQQTLRAVIRSVIDQGHDQIRKEGNFYYLPSNPNDPDNQ